MPIGPASHPAPKITYFDSMRIEIGGKPICAMSQSDFDTWLSKKVDIANNSALTSKLTNAHLDTFFLTDRWFALLTLIEHDVLLT